MKASREKGTKKRRRQWLDLASSGSTGCCRQDPQGQGSPGASGLRLLRLCRPGKGFTILKCLGKISKRIFHDL